MMIFCIINSLRKTLYQSLMFLKCRHHFPTFDYVAILRLKPFLKYGLSRCSSSCLIPFLPATRRREQRLNVLLVHTILKVPFVLHGKLVCSY